MTLLIGTKSLSRYQHLWTSLRAPLFGARQSYASKQIASPSSRLAMTIDLEHRTGSRERLRGFSLIEVLITVSLLGLATVFITQSNLLSSAVYGRYASRVDIQNWAMQKIWETKELLLTSDFPDVSTSQGIIQGKTRSYQWKVSVEEQKEKLTELYLIHLEILWRDGGRESHLDRYGAVMKVKGS